MDLSFNDNKNKIIIAIIAIVSILLQFLVIPRIPLFNGNLNLLLACVVALSFSMPNRPLFLFCGICGLVFDITHQGVFGLCILLFILINFFSFIIQSGLSGNSQIAKLVICALLSGIATLIYLIFTTIITLGATFINVLLSGGILQILFNTLFCVLAYLAFLFIFKSEDSTFMFNRF